MRPSLGFALLGLLSASLTFGQPAPSWPWTHTRWANAAGRALLEGAVRHSTLVRGLLQDLERSNVIVHVGAVMSDGGTSQDPQAHLSFVAAAGHVRYLQIIVCTGRAGAWDAIPLLGHELQHAREVAAAPQVTDATEFERLYYRIGWQSGSRAFETELARTTGRRIRQEMLWTRAAHEPESPGAKE